MNRKNDYEAVFVLIFLFLLLYAFAQSSFHQPAKVNQSSENTKSNSSSEISIASESISSSVQNEPATTDSTAVLPFSKDTWEITNSEAATEMAYFMNNSEKSVFLVDIFTYNAYHDETINLLNNLHGENISDANLYIYACTGGSSLLQLESFNKLALLDPDDYDGIANYWTVCNLLENQGFESVIVWTGLSAYQLTDSVLWSDVLLTYAASPELVVYEVACPNMTFESFHNKNLRETYNISPSEYFTNREQLAKDAYGVDMYYRYVYPDTEE